MSFQRNMPKACPYVMMRFIFVLSVNLYYNICGRVGVKKGKKRGICSVVLKNVLTLHPKMIVYNHPNDCI